VQWPSDPECRGRSSWNHWLSRFDFLVPEVRLTSTQPLYEISYITGAVGLSNYTPVPITTTGGAGPSKYRGRNFGLFLINLCKELPYIVKQEIGLLQSREVPALRHLRILHNIISLLNPAKRRGVNLLRKIRVRNGSL
jgi:hypothetical protein